MKKEEEGLEDYQVANMNVEGMPWYVKRDSDRQSQRKKEEQEPLTRKETWQILLGTLKAALAVGFLFWGALLLFILFCVYCWLR